MNYNGARTRLHAWLNNRRVQPLSRLYHHTAVFVTFTAQRTVAWQPRSPTTTTATALPTCSATFEAYARASVVVLTAAAVVVSGRSRRTYHRLALLLLLPAAAAVVVARRAEALVVAGAVPVPVEFAHRPADGELAGRVFTDRYLTLCVRVCTSSVNEGGGDVRPRITRKLAS